MDHPLDLPYYQMHPLTVSIGGQDLHVITKQGLPHWDAVTPEVELLAEAMYSRKEGPVLILGCGNGFLGVVIARQGGAGSVSLVDTNWIALRVAKISLVENGYETIPVNPLHYPLPAETYRTVVISLPKGRKLARRWLVEAWGALQFNGELYLAGANTEGIQSVMQDAKSLFGNATVLAYRKGCRMGRMVKQIYPRDAPGRIQSVNVPGKEPAWATENGIARGSWFEFTATVCGVKKSLRSLPGVFSYDRVDEGTALLIQQITPEWVLGKRLLDFGCGYGLIGIMAARFGAVWVDMVDVDLSAVAAAQENLVLNQILNAQARPSDVLDAITTERYDLIVSNPPFHAGKQVDYAMAQTFISHSRFILNTGGRLVIVANRFIRYDRLMKDVFGNVAVLVETGKFHLLESVR